MIRKPSLLSLARQKNIYILLNVIKTSQVLDGTVESFHSNGINYIHLAPNTTCISQPIDLGTGGTIKTKIKRYYEEWVIDSWENNEGEFVKHDKKKNKYSF